jgi:hypothetical protein
MAKTEIFTKRMARKIKAEEIEQVGAGYIIARTMRPGSCSAGGGVDWIDSGGDVEF